MIINKLIRICSLQYFRKNETEEEQMQRLEREKPMFIIRKQPSNKYDPDALIVEQGRKKVGYVNADDKKWVYPLLNKCVGRICRVGFDRVVRPSEEGASAVVKCKVEIDLDDVEDIDNGINWDEFNYTMPLLPQSATMDDLHYALDMMLVLLNDDTCVDIELQDMLDVILENCRYDLSAETTQSINDICFRLEMRGDEESLLMLEKLEEASTHRRGRMGIAEWRSWFDSLTTSEEAMYQWHLYENDCKRMLDSVWVNKECMARDLMSVERELLTLPRDLSVYLDHPEELMHKAFYLSIPEEKQMDLLSALVLRETLKKETSPKTITETIEEETVESTEVEKKPENPLFADLMMKYWEGLQKIGLVDGGFKRTKKMTRQTSMYVAESLAQKAGIKSKWKYFEEMWHMKNLAQEKQKMQDTGKMPPYHKLIDNIFSV